MSTATSNTGILDADAITKGGRRPTKAALENVREFAHLLTLGAEVNHGLAPWSPEYRQLTASVAAEFGRTYGAMCRRFGSRAVAEALKQGLICSYCTREKVGDETPMIANGMCVG